MGKKNGNSGKAISKHDWRWLRRNGLSRTILFWLLALSVIPLMVVSIISYRNARASLAHLALDALVAAAEFSTEQIQYRFDRMLLDLKQESEEQANVHFLQRLSTGYAESGLDAARFVKSFKWAKMADRYASDLKTFCFNYSYLDVLLTDLKGNILYTVAGKSDLGANLFATDFEHTRLSHAARKSLESGRPVFSDYVHYAPFNNSQCGFLINILVDDEGQTIGLIILNFSTQLTDTIMQQKFLRHSIASRIYLLGSDLLLRSKLKNKSGALLKTKVETRQSQLWLDEHVKNTPLDSDIMHDASIYPDPFNQEVLGVHRNLIIAGTHWAVIAEIETVDAFASARNLGIIMSGLLMGTIVLIVLISVPLTRRTFRPLLLLSEATRQIADGDLEQVISIHARNEIGDLADNFNEMVVSLKNIMQKTHQENWSKNGQAELNEQMRGEVDVAELSKNVIAFLCQYLNAQVGAAYTVLKEETLQLTGSYAFHKRKGFSNVFKFGENTVGQAALERKTIQISDLPPDYMAVSSGLGQTPPRSIVVVPLVYENRVEGVVELGFMNEPKAHINVFLGQSAESIALAFRVAQSRKQKKALLDQTQLQAQELQVREEELRENNALLEQQSKELRASEERLVKQQTILEEKNEALESQQVELSDFNARLQKSATELEAQKEESEVKNKELEKIKSDLESKAEELVLAGRYKSEFLANMSHELRTPLNSLLILSKMLAENNIGNLTTKQIEYAQTIYEAGHGLLTLINEILDLSKIEAGQMTIEARTLRIDKFIDEVHKQFDVPAEKNGIDFKIESYENAARSMVTDPQKLHQIVSNLLSNALNLPKTVR
ncbi:MAG: GAF domain-containing protein [Desulfatitalea sp.]|nr:GAF domain-containing protein [Desulfatitalea sp.]NNK00638.1 GAF domain-containing protein [Desulfatitalea sp.]